MPSEVLSVHVGQAGCAIGNQFWDTLCQEHGIPKSGQGTPQLFDDIVKTQSSWQTFFEEKHGNRICPRSTFLDTDPASVEKIESGPLRNLYSKHSLLSYKQDCKSNFCEGRTQAVEFRMVSSAANIVRRQSENCDSMQGFLVSHAIGGGTGSGVCAEIMKMLREEFGSKKMIVEPACIFPSPNFASNMVEPYNSVLYNAETMEIADMTVPIDNESCYSALNKKIEVPQPTYASVNSLISKAISGMTASLRYKTQLSSDLAETVGNLIPSKPFRYPVLGMGPLCSEYGERARKGRFGIGGPGDVIKDLFASSNVLCDTGHSLKNNRYMAVAVLLRGRLNNNSKIEAQEVVKQCHECIRIKLVRFLPWQPQGAWKVGIINDLPPPLRLSNKKL